MTKRFQVSIIQISPEGHNTCPPRCEVGFMKSQRGESEDSFAFRVGVEVDRLTDFTGLDYEYQIEVAS